ncbi:3-phosphoshikimate 1-carboxyvinyltransferase [Kitasatospora sp. MAP5-34]|uniref:3-phosphoshikimate 1-carboxyvinyltransferase n=1 Tax=Kitasatospora sp. MAP5-34 TaxID=3035102 RepID=UPI00247599CE|nr:3-phosphoshikimate 1-carboxyvinyltransferase [Kitasatospora sp. MAP5-34]MDH6576294.1 3-phosphoshikimate 1-carboxyvinyltransferase [Kitasatospora sp. MAP5-34]
MGTPTSTDNRGAVTARIPGSKSITNRVLLLAAAAAGTTRLDDPLESEDTVAFRKALTDLGVEVTVGQGSWEVRGTGRGPSGPARIWCADAGTAARFLPVLAATGEGEFVFEGSAQLTARPLGPLVEALAELGAGVEPGAGGGLPLRIDARGLSGGELRLDSSTSSQYLTGLLLSAPLMRQPLTVSAAGLVSRPYIAMTVALMRTFGAKVAEVAEVPPVAPAASAASAASAAGSSGGTVRVEPGGYVGTRIRIEPDASTASYFFAAAALTGTRVTVPHLGRDSLQGDLRFVEVLAKAGAQVEIEADSTAVTGVGPLRGGFEVDMGDISDTFMTLAAIAPLADGPITIRGIGHARLKESDRIAAVSGNLRALGVRVEDGPDWITIHPGRPAAATVACHRDHRIAMAFSVLGLRVPGITLDDPGCVGKTFPGFHEELRRLFGEQAVSTAS